MVTPAVAGRDHHGALYARTSGTGQPVVLLHGLVGSSRYWAGAYARLGEQHHLVVPDLLGFGQSPKPSSGYGPDDHVDALVRLFDEVGVSGPAVIAAHSAGSVIALRMALRYPQRVRAIVAFGPPLYPSPASARAHLGAMGPMAKLFALPGPIAAAVCAWVCAHRRTAARIAVMAHPHLPAAVAADSVKHTWASYTGTLTDVVLDAQATGWLGEISIPVTLVAGRDDRVVDHDHLALVARTTSASVLQWPDDHHLPLRDPERCLALITSALR